MPPFERALYFFGGIALLGWDAFLTYQWLDRDTPATFDPNLNLGAVGASAAISGIFLVAQFMVWKARLSPIVRLLLLWTIALNIWINLEGYKALLGTQEISVGLTGFIICTASVFTAIMAEKLLAKSVD